MSGVEVMDGCLVLPQTARSPAEECDHRPEEVSADKGYSGWNEPVQRERHVHRNVHGIGVDEEHLGAGLFLRLPKGLRVMRLM
jgi:hypothetical protein